MDKMLLVVIAIVATGTYLIRVAPLLPNLRNRVKTTRHAKITRFLQLMGPSLIAALLAVSIDPPLVSMAPSDLFQTGVGITAVVVSYLLWKNPGISVLTGVFFFSVTLFILNPAVH